MNSRLKAYYAHPMALYRSLVEQRDIELIRQLGFEVVNPAESRYLDYQMSDFVELATGCDLIAFRSFADAKVGSGMALEIDAAIADGIPVLELGPSLEGRILSRNETRERMHLSPLHHPETAPLRTIEDEP